MSSVVLDVGGTFLKSARVGADGSIGPVTRRPVPAFRDTTGAAREIDADALRQAVLGAVAGASESGDAPARILVTGQMAGLAFVDPGGRGRAPLVSWQDTRVTDVDAVARALGPALADLGDGLRVGLPLVTLTGIGVPEGARVTSLLAYVAGCLTDAPVPVVHATDAASWGLYDVVHRRWSPAALEVAGLRAEDLPAVSWDLVPVGTTPDGIAVLCAVGDQQAALLGAGLDAGSVSVNLATGCQVSVISDSSDSPAQLRPFLTGSYLHTVTHLPAGRLLSAAVEAARGSTGPEDWSWAAEHSSTDPGLQEAVETIAVSVAGAADRLGARGRPVVLSGGLVQQFAPVRRRILELLGDPPHRVFPGDDAALAGLAVLAARMGP